MSTAETQYSSTIVRLMIGVVLAATLAVTAYTLGVSSPVAIGFSIWTAVVVNKVLRKAM